MGKDTPGFIDGVDGQAWLNRPAFDSELRAGLARVECGD